MYRKWSFPLQFSVVIRHVLLSKNSCARMSIFYTFLFLASCFLLAMIHSFFHWTLSVCVCVCEYAWQCGSCFMRARVCDLDCYYLQSSSAVKNSYNKWLNVGTLSSVVEYSSSKSIARWTNTEFLKSIEGISIESINLRYIRRSVMPMVIVSFYVLQNVIQNVFACISTRPRT